jgi:hypothetical protein
VTATPYRWRSWSDGPLSRQRSGIRIFPTLTIESTRPDAKIEYPA